MKIYLLFFNKEKLFLLKKQWNIRPFSQSVKLKIAYEERIEKPRRVAFTCVHMLLILAQCAFITCIPWTGGMIRLRRLPMRKVAQAMGQRLPLEGARVPIRLGVPLQSVRLVRER